ncbi:MAG: hypothetical protein ABL903_08365 [Methylococcales bacterium]
MKLAKLRNLTLWQNSSRLLDVDILTAIDQHGVFWYCAKQLCQAVGVAFGEDVLQQVYNYWLQPLHVDIGNGCCAELFVHEAGGFRLILGEEDGPQTNEYLKLYTDILSNNHKEFSKEWVVVKNSEGGV